jgi:hypothetical protein
VQDACKQFSTGRPPADSPTRHDGADLGEHHHPQSDNTRHHGPGSPLNLRVRGSSPWRRTMPDLALCGFSPRRRTPVGRRCVQMRAESERGWHAPNPPRRNLRGSPKRGQVSFGFGHAPGHLWLPDAHIGRGFAGRRPGLWGRGRRLALIRDRLGPGGVTHRRPPLRGKARAEARAEQGGATPPIQDQEKSRGHPD